MCGAPRATICRSPPSRAPRPVKVSCCATKESCRCRTLPPAVSAVFSRVQLDWFAVGYGSGGDVKVPYIWNLLAGLGDAGIRVDDDLATILPRLDLREPPESRRHVGQLAAPLRRDAPRARRRGGRRGPRQYGRGRRRSRRGRGATTSSNRQLLPHRRRAAMLDAVTAAFEPRRRGAGIPTTSWTSGGSPTTATASAPCFTPPAGRHGRCARGRRRARGRNSGPSGKLTDTIAASYADYPSSDNFGDPAVSGSTPKTSSSATATSRPSPERVLFPFGFGLGYTSFAVKILEAEVDAGTFRATVEVRNTGGIHAGKEVVQLYVGAPDGHLRVKRLAAFGKTGASPRAKRSASPSASTSPTSRGTTTTGVTGHRSAFVLEPRPLPRLRRHRRAHRVRDRRVRGPRASDRPSGRRGGRHAVPFRRMTLTRDNTGRAIPQWEDVPTASVSHRDRVLAALPNKWHDPAIAASATSRAERQRPRRVHRAALDDELSLLARGDVTMHSPLGATGNARGARRRLGVAARQGGAPRHDDRATQRHQAQRLRVAAASGAALASTWNTALVRELATLHGQDAARARTCCSAA